MDKLRVPVQRLNAEFVPLAVGKSGSGDEKASRRIGLTWYSGATVERFSWADGRYLLRLSLDPAHVRMERLNSGKTPVLDSHSDFSLQDIIGVVESAAVENEQGTAVVRFSAREQVTPIWNDVHDGIIRNASVGARIYKLKDLSKEDDKVKSFLAVDWEPQEISLVPIGADPNAGLAAGREEFTEAEIEPGNSNLRAAAQIQKGESMEDKLTKPSGSDAQLPAVVAAAPNLEEARTAAAAAERQRIAELRKIARAVRLDDPFVEPFIEKGATVEDFRKAVLEKIAANSEALPPTRSASAQVTSDEADARRLAMTNALLHRFSPAQYKLEEPGRDYIGMSLLRLAEECCLAAGKRVRGMTPMELAAFALHSTSDFPNILAATANKTLLAGYAASPQTWRPLAMRDTATDFKTRNLLTFDGNTRLKKVTDTGEFKRGSFVEGKETYKLGTYGEILAITRQVIINDDLGAFTRIPTLLGREVAELENDTVWGVITDNVVLADNVALFHATHANLAAGGDIGAIGIATLDVARAAIRKQKSPGNVFMNLAPRFLVVPAAKQTTAEQFTTPGLMIADQAKVNPFATLLTPIVESRLDANSTTAWYLFVDPAVPHSEVLLYAYLLGQEGPFTETRNGFDVDGVEVKIRHDFAAAAVGSKGAYKNPGA